MSNVSKPVILVAKCLSCRVSFESQRFLQEQRLRLKTRYRKFEPNVNSLRVVFHLTVKPRSNKNLRKS